MPELKWSEHEFVECLGVLAEIDDYNTGYHFSVERSVVRLHMSIWPYESLIALSLLEADNEIFSAWFVVRGRVRYINDKRGTYLLFDNVVIVKPARGYYLEQGDVFDESKFAIRTDLELSVDPIRLAFF